MSRLECFKSTANRSVAERSVSSLEDSLPGPSVMCQDNAVPEGDVAPLSLEGIFGPHGVLVSTAQSNKSDLRDVALYYPYRARAECSLDVASVFEYFGGDYFEFGSDGMGTFRNFLTAFDIFDHSTRFSDTRFYAFDIFGKTTNDDAHSKIDPEYFPAWANGSSNKLEEAHNYICGHGIMVDQCFVRPGYFQETLTDEFKAQYLGEGRKIGYAFLDCNITSSYETVFDFIFELMGKDSAIYMDEYFVNKDVPVLFASFSERLLRERGLASYFMRNAGGFGALFRLMPAP